MKKLSPVYVDHRVFTEFSNYIKSEEPSSVFVLVDENTLKHCYPLVKTRLPKKHTIVNIKSGEKNKTLNTCEKIWQQLTKVNADRKTLLVNLGGGVLSDVGGFAAGCYKRGIKYVNIPTTLLAMVDASVGAKTGVDFNGFKNQIGLFCEPEAVFIYTDFLKTLSYRHLKAGIAEVIKHYLIANRKAYIELSNQLTLKPTGEKQPNIRELNWTSLVKQNVAIKQQIVAKDKFERADRKALNFGHTIGHAVETFYLNRGDGVLHGEAVAIGLLCEAQICVSLGTIPRNEFMNIFILWASVFAEHKQIAKKDIPAIVKLIAQDKKNSHGKNQFTLLNNVGRYTVNNFVELKHIKDALTYYSEIF